MKIRVGYLSNRFMMIIVLGLEEMRLGKFELVDNRERDNHLDLMGTIMNLIPWIEKKEFNITRKNQSSYPFIYSHIGMTTYKLHVL